MEEDSLSVAGVDVWEAGVVDGGHANLPGFNHNPVVDDAYTRLDYTGTILG